MSDLFSPLSFSHGPQMKNRFMVAPLTNCQSHDDGILSEDEFTWLVRRAKGGFGMTMTCAAHVQKTGRGFAGQLGVFSDGHLPGLTRLASAIKEEGNIAILQLHHGGMRATEDLNGVQPVSASDVEKYGARGLSTAETEQLIEDFITAAKRAEKAGFDGVEVHGAHGYLLAQYISPTLNQRDDRFGGNLENRTRIIFDIIDGIRDRCRADFNVSVRLSPERFDMKLAEVIQVAKWLLDSKKIDFLDMSLWDVKKEPVEEEFQGRSLMSYFTELDRGDTRLGVAGKIMDGDTAQYCLDNGADFVMIGRAAILHPDFPKDVEANSAFVSNSLPVTQAYLKEQSLGQSFIDYLGTWPGFVEG